MEKPPPKDPRPMVDLTPYLEANIPEFRKPNPKESGEHYHAARARYYANQGRKFRGEPLLPELP